MTTKTFILPKEMPRFRSRADVEAYLPNIKSEARREAMRDMMDRIYSESDFRDDDAMLERLGISAPGEMTMHFAIKDQHNEQGMFAFVSERWINPFAEWIGARRVLEVMGGAGHIAYALRERGVNIHTTDDMSWHRERGWETITEMENLDAVEAVEKYGPGIDILLMSWPYMDDTAFNVLERLHEINPSALVVYIGEWGGCTADAKFHDHFEEIEDDEKFNGAAKMFQRWAGLHDRLYLGRYHA